MSSESIPAASSRRKKIIGAAAFSAAMAAGGLVGAIVAAPQFSGAQEATTTAPATTAQADPATPATPADPAAPADDSTKPPRDPKLGGHVGANGAKEELLTGDTAAKVTAAALAANPGATIDRVETDVDGATYEAHMTLADGSHITVLFDANFAISGTETGHAKR
jgi:hypothetical protein